MATDDETQTRARHDDQQPSRGCAGVDDALVCASREMFSCDSTECSMKISRRRLTPTQSALSASPPLLVWRAMRIPLVIN